MYLGILGIFQKLVIWVGFLTSAQILSVKCNLTVRGFKKSFIARQFRCHRVTISRIVNGWKRGQYITPKVRAQRRLKLTAQQVHNVLNYFVKNPFDTYNQCIQKLKLPVKYGSIARLLSRNGIRNYVASYKHFLSIQNQVKRLKFAIKYQHWTEADWAKSPDLNIIENVWGML